MSLQTQQRAKSHYFAQPYSLDATGFYFETYEEYLAKSTNLTDSFGQPVEEFELQFIDGDNPELFKALEISQASLEQWFDDFELLDGHQVLIATYLAEQGCTADEVLSKLDDFHIFEGKASEYAAELLEETQPDIPDFIWQYIDFEAIARDMEINGEINELSYDVTLVLSLIHI